MSIFETPIKTLAGEETTLAEHEGKGYAEFLAAHGINAYVLKYRLGSNGYRHPIMLQDAARGLRLLREHGFAIVNVDVVVIAQRPKIAPHVDAMRARIAETLGITIDRVGIKGKTNETVDATGRGEAIAAHAVAVLVACGGER